MNIHSKCAVCESRREELEKLRAENSSLRAIVRVIRRAIEETSVETVEEMNTLNLDAATRLLVIEALDRSGGNRTIAAQLLGVARSTMFQMIDRYQIRDIRPPKKKANKPQDWVIEGLRL